MSDKPLKEALAHPEKVRVLVELEARECSEPTRERLEKLGLEIDRVIRNKVLGTIEGARLPELEADERVRAVERSTELGLHED